MFTPDERERLRADLVAAARADDRITGAAVTGSAAVGREDRWSDIDLALCLTDGAPYDDVVADWTAWMYEHGAVHHVDVYRGATLFRVFLLAATLQVDLAFWRADEFGAIGPAFRLLFGTANELPPARPHDAVELIGLGWLYALHARSSIARGRVWQAEAMITGVRERVLALACLRHGLNAVEARGADDLPPSQTGPFAAMLVRSPDEAELRRALAAAGAALLAEASMVDAALADRLAAPLREIASFGTGR